MKRMYVIFLVAILVPGYAFSQVCQDITERMTDGSAAQRAAITARVKQLRDEGRDVYVTAKSTYSTIHAVCKVAASVPTCTFSLNPISASVPFTTGNGTVTVTTSPANCSPTTYAAASGVSWMTTSVAGSTVTYLYQANSATSPRNGMLTIAGQLVTITQAGAPVVPPPPQCVDGIDNDGDGLVDSADPGCSSLTDNDETNAAPTPGGDVIIDARFEENISRTDPNAAQLFLNTGIWSHVKTQQNSSGAHGYLYTSTTVPGYSGTLPGGGQRVLVVEALPLTLNGQTDFYLGYGSDVGPANVIPGDVWFQWWEWQTPESRIGSRDKWLYPCNSGYGCHSHLWMFMRSCLTYLASGDAPHGCGPGGNGGAFGVNRQSDGVSFIENTTGDPDARGNIGPQAMSPYLQPGRWNLVKVHFNTNNANSGVFEMWIKPQDGQFVKVADWKGGITPGFTWTIPPASVGGHRVIRFPTTVDNNFTIYMDDFMMTRTEAALRVYGATPAPEDNVISRMLRSIKSFFTSD